MKKFARFGLALVVVQIFLGAWTASNYAALACGSKFPGCHASLWPEMSFSGGFNFFQTIGPNYLGGLFDNESRVAIHYMHRIGAVLVSCYLIALFLLGRHQLPLKEIKAALWIVLTVLVAQVLLGVINVIWLIPLPIAVAHNAVGALLLLTLVNLNFQLSRVRSA